MHNIFISAGEPSGDLLGADLARALLQKNPALQLTGMGGWRMKNAGVSIVFDSEKLSVMGIFEILTYLPVILSTLHATKKYLQQMRPNLIVLIDFADWHFRVMKAANKLGIPVLYYVSPKLWATRPKRINYIKKYVSHMAVLFAFEEKIYRDAGIPVTFVGHPLSDLAKPTMTKAATYDFFTLDANKPIIALFPGSRYPELYKNLPVMIESVQKIQAQQPNTQFVLFLANRFQPSEISIPNHIKIIQNNLYDLLQITHAAIAVSGTVTLEIALMQVPLCILYKLNPISYWIIKMAIQIKLIGLCNIVAEKEVAKEFIQQNATADNISGEIIKLLVDEPYYANIKKELGDIRNHIAIKDHHSSELVANIAMELIA